MGDPPVSPWRWTRDLGWRDADPWTPIFDGMFRALAARWKSLDDAAGIPEDRRVEVGTVGLHHDADGDGKADRESGPVGYVYTDPVEDEKHPWITAEEVEAPDAFPENWSSEPTERDRAAIEAGNA